MFAFVFLFMSDHEGIIELLVTGVNEWCSDWYSETYYQVSPEENPPGPESGEFRVYRGGDYTDSGMFLRSAIRNFGVRPDSKSPQIGFRLVRVVK